MKKILIIIYLLFFSFIFVFLQCSQKPNYGGFENQIKWGEHLVTIGGCSDCHTPKKMTPNGPVPDNSLFLSGHPAQMPPPEVDRKEVESKGLAVTQTLTAWVGPWAFPTLLI